VGRERQKKVTRLVKEGEEGNGKRMWGKEQEIKKSDYKVKTCKN
jgi:hypothetical protein